LDTRRRELRDLSFSIDPTPPFRLDLTAWAIRRRPENAIDGWNGERYERVLAVQGTPVLVSVTQSGAIGKPRLDITATADRLPKITQSALTKALERLLGLRINLARFYRIAAQHPRLNELASRFRGLKPPRFPTVWEGLINGIACQQFSLAVGITLLNRLAAATGLRFASDPARHAFPEPDALADAAPEELRSMGFNRAKTREMIELGKAIVSGRLNLEPVADMSNDDALSRLLRLPGVGRWTAEYVLLRGMGRIDIFPGDDIGARNNLGRWLRLRAPLDYNRVGRIVDKWRPYAGLVYFHLLLDGLDRAGYLKAGAAGAPMLAMGDQKMIKLKRVYDEEAADDGVRYLIERLWPRGIKKASLRMDAWLKDAGPSTELRKWFSHDAEKWDEFRRRYFAELDRAPEAWTPIRDAARRGTVTLLYSSHDTEHNNAVALEEYVAHQAGVRTRATGGHTRR
jgi:DNA-3-methyladenine glycosylase II